MSVVARRRCDTGCRTWLQSPRRLGRSWRWIAGSRVEVVGARLPGAVLRQQAGMHPRVVPLPPTQLWCSLHLRWCPHRRIGCTPAAIAPLVVVLTLRQKPDIEPAKPKRRGGRPPAPSPRNRPEQPTAAWPPGPSPVSGRQPGQSQRDKGVPLLLPSRSMKRANKNVNQ